MRMLDLKRTYEVLLPKVESDMRKKELMKYYYSLSKSYYGTCTGDDDYNVIPTMPAEIDLFSNIPIDAYKNSHFYKFVQLFNRILISRATEKITFSKFVLTELTENTVEVEWIYNYFRIYFDFDSTGKDSFGCVEKDPLNGQLSSWTGYFGEDEYRGIIESQIDYVIMMMEG